jgi:hypothetical protein
MSCILHSLEFLKWMSKNLGSLTFIFEWVSDQVKMFMHAKSRMHVNL